MQSKDTLSSVARASATLLKAATNEVLTERRKTAALIAAIQKAYGRDGVRRITLMAEGFFKNA